ncbi:MAG: hypothetical protein K0S75_975 [Clostridia bacterium]|jgi:hypothetical protein|nr:hypothetical protein [Clostridia bacterium]
MKKILVQIRNKEVLLSLKKHGEVELVSASSNIYSMIVKENAIKYIERINGVICIEEDEMFECQGYACV